MARILVKQRGGEPGVGRLRNSWGYRPGRNSLRGKLSIRTLRKANPADPLGVAGVETQTVSSDGTIRVTAGTVVPGTRSATRIVRKVQNLTPRQAKGTKVVTPPSPTNRGGIRSPYSKRQI